MMHAQSFYLMIPLFLNFVSAISIRQANSTVTTTSGVVQGHAAQWPPGNSLVEYLGIPYAQNPTGQRRFSAPVAYTSNQPFDAAAYSMDCLQFSPGETVGLSSLLSGLLPEQPPALKAYGFGMGGGSDAEPHQYGENCLSVNIWTKPGGEAKKAVMVWIYGGAFASGTSNAPFYNGRSLCFAVLMDILLTEIESGGRLAQDEDVVVVSMNYRVGFWGFPHAPGIEDQNLGLLDQRLAVEWVRDNIAGFNGDPARITIFGESAGGSSVDLYSFAWTKDPIVNGFIGQSGTAITSLSGAPLTEFDDWYEVSSYTGCGGEEAGPAATVACMRNASADAILAALGTQSPYTQGLGISYGPVADGKVVFEDVKDRAERGDHIKRPMLNGNNDKELGLILGGIKAFISPWLQSLVTGPISDEVVNFGSDSTFGCTAALTSALRTKNNVRNWRYRFMPVYDNTALAPLSGTYHSMDVPFATGTNSLRPNSTPDTPEEAALQTYMVHAWAEFAKDPDEGLSRLGWPTYDPNGELL